MKVKCEYCGQFIDDTEAICPHCGAPNDALWRGGKGVPQTIEELKAFCEKHNLPLETMRFFLGEDYRGAKAFGIYEDSEGNFVVYKNKADGSRAVRYKGKDEAYAVNELYQRMKSEIANQRSHRAAVIGSKSASSGRKIGKTGNRILLFAFVAAYLILQFCVAILPSRRHSGPSTGYYSYNDSYYYYQNNDWYLYDDDYYTWAPVAVDEALADNADQYYESYSYYDSYGVDNFADSSYYEEPSSWSSDDDWDDSDWDWDSGSDSWDSGWTDWDSDW